jgi:hypothetical protein
MKISKVLATNNDCYRTKAITKPQGYGSFDWGEQSFLSRYIAPDGGNLGKISIPTTTTTLMSLLLAR